MARLSLDNPEYYLNRDTSWLAFNERVLEEAEDAGNPLLERLKFLAISASNLDEFFEIRVAAMVQQIEDGYNEAGPDGLSLTDKRDILARLEVDCGLRSGRFPGHRAVRGRNRRGASPGCPAGPLERLPSREDRPQPSQPKPCRPCGRWRLPRWSPPPGL